MQERRITLRLLAYWERLRGDRSMPTEVDIDPDYLQDLWDYCFLLHIKDLAKPDYNYTYLGSAIRKAYEGDLSGNEHQDIASLNASKLAGSYNRVATTCLPLINEGEFRNSHNDLVKYRQCLLPLGEGNTVDAIFGGMRFKVFNSD
ncbi:MAG: PAS domain-containing protein [Rickettsiales bacterium]